MDRAYDQAFVRPTAEDRDRLHTDDFMMTARGTVTTKAELVARLNDPGHPRQVIESLTSDNVKVRIYGDTAVTTGRWKRVSKNAEGKDTSAVGYFTRVWVKRNKDVVDGGSALLSNCQRGQTVVIEVTAAGQRCPVPTLASGKWAAFERAF